MDDVLLETERLRLRRFTQADGVNLHALDNDPAVMRYINGGTHTPWMIIQRQILPIFLGYDDQFPGFGFWAAEEKSSGAFVGWFSFRPTESQAMSSGYEVSLGYRLRQEVWRQGYATEGAAALIDKGFRELGVARVVASTYEDNLASRRVMEKLGMEYVRSFRLTQAEIAGQDTSFTETVEIWDGEDVLYALERSDWMHATQTA